MTDVLTADIGAADSLPEATDIPQFENPQELNDIIQEARDIDIEVKENQELEENKMEVKEINQDSKDNIKETKEMKELRFEEFPEKDAPSVSPQSSKEQSTERIEPKKASIDEKNKIPRYSRRLKTTESKEKEIPLKTTLSAPAAKKMVAINSSIPVAKKSPPVKKGSYLNHPTTPLSKSPDKKTLELQFLTNKKMFLNMHKEWMEKQRPIQEKYKCLLRIKKQLEELGKSVPIDDINCTFKGEDPETPKGTPDKDANEILPTKGAKSALDKIILKFNETCDAFMNRQREINKRLGSTMNETGGGELELIDDGLKEEAKEVQSSFLKLIEEKAQKITDMLENWNSMIDTKKEEEFINKINSLETKIQEKDRSIFDLNRALHLTQRKSEEQKEEMEQTLLEQIKKTEDELAKEKKNGAELLKKTRNQNSKVTELQKFNQGLEDAQAKNLEKIKRLQALIKEKEEGFQKEKEELTKKMETALKEQRTVLDKRSQEQGDIEKTYQARLENAQNEILSLKNENMQIQQQNRTLQQKIDELEGRLQHTPDLSYYKDKLIELQQTVDMQLKEKAKGLEKLDQANKLIATLKVEKECMVKYSNQTREALREAREEIDNKTRNIYQLHENLVVAKQELDKLRSRHEAEKKIRSRCTVCGKRNDWEQLLEALPKVGNSKSHQDLSVMSDSLIGMSVEKVDRIRARIDALKKIHFGTFNNTFTNNFEDLRKQIELKSKLYQILQKHADESCEDFIKLLKYSITNNLN